MTTTKTTSTTTRPRKPRQEQAANNKYLRTNNTTETETGCNRNKKKNDPEGNSRRETSLEAKAAAATKSSPRGKSYMQERRPRADQKERGETRRQRQPRAAQEGNHEGRQAWETSSLGDGSGSQEQPRREITKGDIPGYMGYKAAAKSSPEEIMKGDKLGTQRSSGGQEQPRMEMKRDKLGRQGGSGSQEQPRSDKLGKQGRRDRQYFFLRFPCSLAFAHPPWPQVSMNMFVQTTTRNHEYLQKVRGNFIKVTRSLGQKHAITCRMFRRQTALLLHKQLTTNICWFCPPLPTGI